MFWGFEHLKSESLRASGIKIKHIIKKDQYFSLLTFNQNNSYQKNLTRYLVPQIRERDCIFDWSKCPFQV